MSTSTAARNPALLSYHAMRKLVGIIALVLPVALVGGNILVNLLGPAHLLPQPLLQRSISDYYYTPMRSLLEGCLWVIAVFLVCSRGYDRHDEISGYLAGLFTLGVALIPPVDPRLAQYTSLQIKLAYIHTAFAALMFLAVAYFCLFLFRRSATDRKMTRSKQHRNRIYGACGIVIVVCMAMMVWLTIRGIAEWSGPFHPLLCCESLALFAFGISWLTKGEGLMRDLPHERLAHAEALAR